MRTLALSLSLALLPTAEALACGGFFCNRDFPIDQAGETVVFAVDQDSNTVTTHVSIAYEGASEDFAWIVPTPSQPELFTSSDAMFSGLAARTTPTFSLQYDVRGNCWNYYYDYDVAAGFSDTGAVAENDGGGGGGGVTIVAEEQVGPYDTVILQATDANELLTWLNNAGYDLPSTLDTVLEPYLANNQYFVALKLSAGRETGDLVPLGMRYSAQAASIPIQLTSIAATPDMPLTVYLLAEDRAVPDNYLHVRINEAAIDWFDNGSNYTSVISLAADEAGGHAFATDYSGSTTDIRGTLFNEAAYDSASLLAATGPEDWLGRLLGMGLPPSAALLRVFETVIPFPPELESQGISPQNFYDCLSCYSEYVDAASFDAAAATATLEEQLINGLREAEAMLAAHGHMTRLTSSLDAVEMTVDPMFTFNGDIAQDQSNYYWATLRIDCGAGEGWADADRTLVLSDGREINLPSESWFDSNGVSEFDLMEEGGLTEPAAIIIEDLGERGEGEVLFDYRDEANQAANRFRRAACGCQTASPLAGLGLGLVLFPLVTRRRQS